MLVVVSDLHLSDESAAPQNIPAEAFAIWLDEVLGYALQNGAKEVVLLYLGDIVDLLRTEYWFYPAPGEGLPKPGSPQPEVFPLEHRPWGSPNVADRDPQMTPECVERARAILEAIRTQCQDQLAFISGDLSRLGKTFRSENAEQVGRIEARLAECAGEGIELRRVYVPGNHDRLFLLDDQIRQGILDALGAAPSEQVHSFQDDDYGVIARHGHEWDVWNFEAHREGQQVQVLPTEDFRPVPIGDPVTTELVARLPYQMYLGLADRRVAKQTRSEVYAALKHIEDVRPLHAAIKWVLLEGGRMGNQRQGREREAILSTLTEVARKVMADFMEIPFVHRWVDLHDRFNIGMDEADKLQDVDRMMRVVHLESVSTVLGLVEKLQGLGLLGGEDACAKGVTEERLLSPARESEGIRYCVYGHTHSFVHEPVACDATGGEKVYFNSGTWRPRVVQTRDGRGFTSVKEMTYLVFYSKDEDLLRKGVHKGTSYETWNGLMLKRERAA